MPAGFRANAFSGAQTYSAKPPQRPLRSPKTSSPGWNRSTLLADRFDSPGYVGAEYLFLRVSEDRMSGGSQNGMP